MAYNERTETQSPSNAKIALDRGMSQRTYPVSVANFNDVFNLSTAILGTCNYAPSADGRLNRQLPLADPIFTSFFAESIDTLRGVGKPTQETTSQGVESPIIGDVALYPYYDMTVSFTQRQYSVLPDQSIVVAQGSWFPDPNTDSTGTQQKFNWANEWTRFVEAGPIKPAPDFMTQQTGLGMSFNATVAGGDNPNAKPFPNIITMKIPNFLVSLIWRFVPLRFITSPNSFIASKNWQNRVNQNAMQLPFNGVGDFIQPGCLLYVDYSYVPYTPCTGKVWNVFGNGDASQKFCDITLNFMLTTRKLPTGAGIAVAPTNSNYVTGGFNLLPWALTRNFYYACTKSADKRPAYLSAPLELLFTDPDSPQPNVIG